MEHVDDARGVARQEFLGEAEQKTPVPVELDHRAFVVGEGAAQPQRAQRHQVWADHACRQLVELGDGQSVHARVPRAPALLAGGGAPERVVAHHRVHDANHHGRLETGAEPFQRPGQGGDGEEGVGLVDAVRRPPARQRARERHRQRRIAVGEGGDERAAGHERGDEPGDQARPRGAAFDEIVVDPVGLVRHDLQQGCQFGGCPGHVLGALAAHPPDQGDQIGHRMARGQRGDPVGGDIAEVKGGAHQLHEPPIIEVPAAITATRRKGARDGRVGGEPLGGRGEVEIPVQLGQILGLPEYPGSQFGVVRRHRPSQENGPDRTVMPGFGGRRSGGQVNAVRRT